MTAPVGLRAERVLNRLCKWRSVFAGWQLGTRTTTDPECEAVRDHREVTMLLRVEASALAAILIAKGVCTAEEFTEQVIEEAEHLDRAYQQKFPGIEATDQGIVMDPAQAVQTMRHWKP